jgi:hypothetical protein
MPEGRLARTRRAYDLHVRFTASETSFRATTGEDVLRLVDAIGSGWILDAMNPSWRRPSETDAEQLQRRAVLEPDEDHLWGV